MDLHNPAAREARRTEQACMDKEEAVQSVLRDSVRSSWPVYAEDEIAEVLDVLKTGRVNALHHGERCRAFEAAFRQRFEMPHAIAVSNGTLALELALRALEIGPGDEVIVPSRSFIASASCVIAVGAQPVFADVDAETQGLNADTVAAALTARTRAIIVVHLAGWPCAMNEIMVLAQSYGLKVVEDCAQAHGATLAGRPVGSFGDAAAFSFCTDKIISTGGEGGMLLLRDAMAWERAWAYKDHGKRSNPPPSDAAPGAFRWLHASLGSNYRLTEMQAGIGLRQLGKLSTWLEVRRTNAAILDRWFAPMTAIRTTQPPDHVGHAYYKYYAFLRADALKPGWNRDRILAELIRLGVPAGSGSCPEIYREEAFDNSASVPLSPLPVAKALGQTSMMFPVDPTMDTAALEQIGRTVRDVVNTATKSAK